ncbi:MAG: hypothetical protein HPY66_1643 [Firmicutes bacterium]|nr:hypothetical protein [Bacillota bacterium]
MPKIKNIIFEEMLNDPVFCKVYNAHVDAHNKLMDKLIAAGIEIDIGHDAIDTAFALESYISGYHFNFVLSDLGFINKNKEASINE